MSATEAVFQPPRTNARAVENVDEEPITQETIYYPVIQRDPQDIRTILRLSFSSLLFAVLSLTLSGLLIYKLTRRPELVVVEGTPEGDRVVGDDRHYTMQGSVQVRPDRPGDGDKKYLVAKWAESFFRIDPQIRRADIVRGLKLMTPDAAVALVEQVKQTGEWETQRREEWQTVWKPQVITVSTDDPYKVQVVGQQSITKTVSGLVQHASRQIICTLILKADSAQRTEDNQNTGFRIAGLADMKVLDESPASATSQTSISVAPPE
ncbi:MAG TPA: hypothetical protein VIX17_14110 [Pyrinomonadaceae bacterium]|jgi:hypothetical protein